MGSDAADFDALYNQLGHPRRASLGGRDMIYDMIYDMITVDKLCRGPIVTPSSSGRWAR